MPLTPIQKEVLILLARHRNPDSHMGGGAVINRAETSPRYSADLDMFHDAAEQVLTSAEADVALLCQNGYNATWFVRQPYLMRAEIEKAGRGLRLDWCHDSAFRFFPVQPDPEFGYVLHPADLATNKVLALAGRAQVRDFLDIIYVHQSYLKLGAVCWAACGKDQGFTPWSLLEEACRNTKYRQEELEREHLARPVSLSELKHAWTDAAQSARALFAKLPETDIGCLYLDASNQPCSPDPDNADFANLVRHHGSVRGAWPQITK